MTTRVMKRRPPCGEHLLYPLSYGPIVVDPAGFEPATWRVTACSSIGIRHAFCVIPAALPPGPILKFNRVDRADPMVRISAA